MEVTSLDLNLRHLRAVSEVSRVGGISQAAGLLNMSQPAITHGIKSIEDQIGARLFDRGPRGMSVTALGQQFAFRIDRVLATLNARLPKSRQGKRTGPVDKRASTAQLKTLVAIAETFSFSAAARQLGLAQPTVYRAARELEAVLDIDLFEKTARGVVLTLAGERLAQNTRLAFAEMDQALQEICEVQSKGSGQIRVGALPLARATFLSQAINDALTTFPTLQVYVDDGPYPELLQALTRGRLDVLIGALREPAPAPDVVQEPLFEDRLGVFCGPDHPVLSKARAGVADLMTYPWVVPRDGTPTRRYFETAFGPHLGPEAPPLTETSSMILVRELLQSNQRLTLISRAQVATEVRQGQLFEIPMLLDDPPRIIGLTYRKDWYPTEAQRHFLAMLSGSRRSES